MSWLCYQYNLAKKLVILVISFIKWRFSSEGFECQKSCHPHEHLTPNSGRLEASKKVLLVYKPQGAAKLRAVKFKEKICFYIIKVNTETLILCHFAAHGSTWTRSSLLEVSNFTLSRVRCYGGSMLLELKTLTHK